MVRTILIRISLPWLATMLLAWTAPVIADAPMPFNAARAALVLAAGAADVRGQDRTVAVIYPKLGDPYRSVFAQIVAGIREASSRDMVSIELTPDISVDELADQLHRQQAGVVIALGRQGLKLAARLPDTLPIVGGAVLASPEDRPGSGTLVSLAPDPRLLIEQLKRLAPSVKRVHVVYSPQQNRWLMELAASAARSNGVDLLPIETDDLRAALKEFHAIMDTAKVGQDAIWLPQDSRVLDEQVVLPFVLQAAWDRSIIVFSSTLGHVRRGALFALYPDNAEMGRQLATSASTLLSQKGAPAIEPVNTLRLALNTRTAGHLGLNIEPIENDIALRFPAR